MEATSNPSNDAAANPLSQDFDKLVQDLLAEYHVPGLAIAIVDKEHTWTKGYGLADVTSKAPVTPNTIFAACSTTKAFTAAAIAGLIDSKTCDNPSLPGQKVDWTTPISQIIPDDFVLEDKWATANLTLEDALTHRTGMGSHQMLYGCENASVRSVVRSLRHIPLSSPPRTKFEYTNLMYVVASHAVETLTAQPLSDVLKSMIWEPLGMDETYFRFKDAAADGAELEKGYYWHKTRNTFVEVPYMPLEELTGDGAIVSSVADYARWLRALITQDKLFTPAVHETIKAPRIFDSISPGHYDTPPAYALGWRTMSYKGHRMWAHNGGDDAFGAEVYFFPGLQFGVVIFANTATSSNYVGILLARKLIDDRVELPVDSRQDWRTKFREAWARSESTADKAMDAIFPDRPKQSLKTTLPIEKYKGVYTHAAFQDLEIFVGSPSTPLRTGIQLWATRPTATWNSIIELEHVSGEFWVAYSYLASSPTTVQDIGRLEFQIGVNGVVHSLELAWGTGPSPVMFTFHKVV